VRVEVLAFVYVPKRGFQSLRQPTRSIGDALRSEGFTRKIEDVREADFRFANRLRPQGATAADNVGCEPPQIPLSKPLKPSAYPQPPKGTGFEPSVLNRVEQSTTRTTAFIATYRCAPPERVVCHNG